MIFPAGLSLSRCRSSATRRHTMSSERPSNVSSYCQEGAASVATVRGSSGSVRRAIAARTAPRSNSRWPPGVLDEGMTSASANCRILLGDSHPGVLDEGMTSASANCRILLGDSPSSRATSAIRTKFLDDSVMPSLPGVNLHLHYSFWLELTV